MASPSSSLQSPDSGSSDSGTYLPSQMAGSSGQSPSNPASQDDSQSKLASVIAQIKSSEDILSGIVQSFPNAAPETRKAIEAIRAVARRIAANPGSSEPTPPASQA